MKLEFYRHIFKKKLKYQISWKSAQWEPSYYMWPVRRADRYDDANNTSQQGFGTREFYCVSNVTFHAESKYAIKSFPSLTVFVQWPF